MRARGGGVIVAAWLLLSAFAPGASADNGVQLQINGGGTRYLSGPVVDAARDVPLDTRTSTRSADGRVSVDGVGGTSVAALVELAPIPRRFIRSISFPRVGRVAGEVTLTGDEVRDGFTGDPAGSPRFATVYTGYGHGVHFFRPLRGTGDVNVRDEITTANDGDLVVRLATTNGTVRNVAAAVDDATPEPGSPVGFTARVQEPPAGVGFTYSWDFGDGSSGEGAAPSHRFAAGHYRVTVTAVGDDGSAGVSSPLDVQVGTPRPSPTPTPSSGNPGAGGGARAGGGEAPKDQRASGPRRSRTRGERRQRSKRTPTPTATVSPTPAPSAAPPAAAAPAAAPFTAGAGTLAGQPRAAPRSSPAKRPPPAPASPPAASQGESVDGIVLASAGSAADVIASARSAQARSPARRGGGGDSALGWFGGGGLLVALLGLGAVREGGLRWRARSA